MLSNYDAILSIQSQKLLVEIHSWTHIPNYKELQKLTLVPKLHDILYCSIALLQSAKN